jgi:hypothetical protein
MTAPRDPDRLIRLFLEEGLSELPDHSFDAVRAHIHRTRQRAVIGPWREPHMTTFVRVLASAAAVAVVVAGLALISRPTGPAVSSPPLSPPPTATSPAPSSGATFVPSAALSYTWPEHLTAGHYATSMAWDVPFAIGFDVPSGWESRDVEVTRGDMSVALQIPWGLYADPCSTSSGMIDTGVTTTDFALAFGSVHGLAASDPEEVTFGGVRATAITYYAVDILCGLESSKLWSNPEFLLLPVRPLGPPSWPIRAGMHRLWILDTPGIRTVVDATAGSSASSAEYAELQGILDSIEIIPPTEERALGACSVELTLPAEPTIELKPEGSIPMGTAVFPVLGAAPVDLFGPPYAHVDFRVMKISGSGPPSERPTTRAVPPPGSSGTGLSALMTAPESGSRDLVGTFLLNAPGTWWVGISIPYAGCAWQQPLVITPG